MQFPLFFCIISISITISNASLASRFLQNRDSDIFIDATVDPALISNQPSFEQISLPDQITDLELEFFDDNDDPNPMPGLDSNLFLADDVNLNQVTGSSILLADDNSCDLGDADDIQLFGKVRRQPLCWTSPEGQAIRRKKPKKDDELSNLRFFYTDQMVLDLSEAMCPPYIFGTSILPVCLNTLSGHIVPVPGQFWFDLQDVSGTSANDPYWTTESVADANETCEAPEPLGCPSGVASLWCCQNVFTRVRKINQVGCRLILIS